jgi:hypothetical protein
MNKMTKVQENVVKMMKDGEKVLFFDNKNWYIADFDEEGNYFIHHYSESEKISNITVKSMLKKGLLVEKLFDCDFYQVIHLVLKEILLSLQLKALLWV